MSEPCELTASAAAKLLAAKRLSSEELVRSCLKRIAARGKDVRAWAWIDPDLAVKNARAADRAPRRSALHGIPVGIKDMIDTGDMPTQHNSPIYRGHRPGQDAAVAAILRAAGAVILGKTDTHEFAAGGHLPKSRNPHDLKRTAGGSSAGSAAAVADGQVPLALGTQTAGSTIRPASFCGAAAMKPTFGTVSREGAKFYSVSLDTIGWFGRCAADLGLLADCFAVARKPWKPLRSVKGLRIGLCRTPYWESASAETRAAIADAAARLAAAGASVTEIKLPKPFASANALQNIIMRGEGRAAFLAEYRRAYKLLHQEFRDRVDDSDNITPEKLAGALDEMARLRPVFDAIAGKFDAILTPSAVGEAPLLKEKTTGDPVFNRLWSALHVPCIALPWAEGSNGLPVGIQLVSARYRDAELIGVAAAVEGLAL